MKTTEIGKIIKNIDKAKDTQKQYSERVEAIEILLFDHKLAGSEDKDSEMMHYGYLDKIQNLQKYIERNYQVLGKLQYELDPTA